ESAAMRDTEHSCQWAARSRVCLIAVARLRTFRTSAALPLIVLRGSDQHSCDLCRRTLWNRAELLHHRLEVDDSPMLAGETVVIEPNDVDQLPIDVLAARGHTHELALVSSGGPHPGN